MSWLRYCGVGRLEQYSSTEGEQPHAKGTTNIYERVQIGSSALSEDQRQEYQKGSHEIWALETVHCIIGVNNWRNRASKRFLAVGIRPRRREEIRRLKRELEVTRQERDILKKVVSIFSKEAR